MTQIHDLTVTELAAAIRTGETSSAEITEHYLERIDRLNEQVGAFYTVTHELAREEAARADKAASAWRKDGSAAGLPALTGVPIPIKDLNMVAGVRLTFGSTILADNVADQDDYMVGHLRDAGIVITGKTATPEFGLPCYTETKIGPPARTPWDLTRSAGGSSGGAAAAVSSGLAPAAQGSDGGGSIRIPASVCGLFGIKPTRGRISQGPMMPDLTGLSIDGPLARTVADAAAPARRDDRQSPGRHVHASATGPWRFVPRIRQPGAGQAAHRTVGGDRGAGCRGGSGVRRGLRGREQAA